MIQQEDIDAMMEDIAKEDGNVVFVEEVYKNPEPITPDFWSLLKFLFFGGKI